MINKTIKKQSRNITLIGSFNPKIFHPEWFFLNNLIRKQEKEAAEIRFITNDVASFKMEWLIIEVMRERFSASAIGDVSFEQLRDLILGTFELLNHTPVTMVGFNYDYDFEVSDKAYWHEIGYFISGKSNLWGKVLPDPRLLSLNIESPMEESIDFITRKLSVTVSPSSKNVIETGLHFHVNDHFEAKDKEKSITAAIVGTVLKERWDVSQKYAEAAVMSALQLIMEGIGKDGKTA